MTAPSSQQLESFVPVYDYIPEKWEDAKAQLSEQLKRIANAINVREIGWFLDEELLSGKQFFPGAMASAISTSSERQFRSIFRKVIPCSPLVPGVNPFNHGITVDANFTLMQMYAAASNTTAPFASEPIPNGADTITMDQTKIYITVAAGWDRANAVIEYIQET